MISIIPSNTNEINTTIPTLKNPYEVVENFTETLTTDLSGAAIATSAWGSYDIHYESKGYLDVLYTQLDITVAYNDTNSQWDLTSVVESCNKTTELI